MGGFGQLYGEEEAEYVPKLVSENQDLVRKKSVKSQGILFYQVGGNPDKLHSNFIFGLLGGIVFLKEILFM
ncbi:hypothetical protein DPMN_121906 [Dreissena polymorpha]|uniref:Uncharacterized protein n=1 Tax=Dreissena polymorpha TaxID=45954 RepID=A0A9D4JTZ8_DREPO|nr:hypothetical protein DPMN_121906 [Dreissena polymorpha]